MPGPERTLAGLVAAVLAALAVAGCGVHKPLDRSLKDVAAASPQENEPILLGGLQRSASAAGAPSAGFILVGGPPVRIARARQAETVDGFDMTPADAPSTQSDAASEAPAEAGQVPAESDPAPTAAASPRRYRLPTQRPAHPAALPARTPAARPPQDLKALAVVQAAPSVAAKADDPAPAALPAAGPGVDAGRMALFLLCILAAGGLWIWHRSCQRAVVAPRPVRRTA